MERISHTYTSFPVCPYCGHIHSNVNEWGGWEGDKLDCDSCEQPFRVWSRVVYVTAVMGGVTVNAMPPPLGKGGIRLVISDHLHVAKKEYRCDDCRKFIRPGDSYRCLFGSAEPRDPKYELKMCMPCYLASHLPEKGE